MLKIRTPWSSGCLFLVIGCATAVAQVDVGVARPLRKDLTRTLTITGSLQPMIETRLMSRVSGQVTNVHVDLGDAVTTGSPLVDLEAPELLARRDAMAAAHAVAEAEVLEAERNSSTLTARIGEARAEASAIRAAHVRAEAVLEAARMEARFRRTTFERFTAMRAKDAVMLQQLDEAETRMLAADGNESAARAGVTEAAARIRLQEARVGTLEAEKAATEVRIEVRRAQRRVAEARLAEATGMVDFLTVRAPFDGHVSDRWVHPGVFVRGGDTPNPTGLLHLNGTGPMRLVAEIPAAESSAVRKGQALTVSSRSFDGLVASKVERISPANDRNTRGLRIEAWVDDPRLRVGEFVAISVDIETRLAVLALPLAAVGFGRKGASVLIVVEGVVARVDVVTGIQTATLVEVREGLRGDEAVIVRGGDRVRAGSSVRAIEDPGVGALSGTGR